MPKSKVIEQKVKDDAELITKLKAQKSVPDLIVLARSTHTDRDGTVHHHAITVPRPPEHEKTDPPIDGDDKSDTDKFNRRQRRAVQHLVMRLITRQKTKKARTGN